MNRFSLLILVSVALSTAHLDRIYKMSQDLHVNPETSCKSCLNFASQSDALHIEVFQVLEFPLSIHQASLTKSERGGHFLQLSLGNSSDLKILGLRYSLASIDARNEVQIRVNRTEGFSLPAYDMKTLTFKTPIRLKQKDGERFLLMIEQVISRESIWEVVKAKDALEAYARGDFSVVPSVLRVANQVDSPPADRVPIYFRKN
jgi:hypothetical protein